MLPYILKPKKPTLEDKQRQVAGLRAQLESLEKYHASEATRRQIDAAAGVIGNHSLNARYHQDRVKKIEDMRKRIEALEADLAKPGK